ncbi:MAG TPA: hypothetical protein VMB03_13465 [Bryobacteraceae bacterium]|nr:hypothetical protein [Bryobacteraceae bacterium]
MAKLRRTPYRCRGCQNRFYVYVPREDDEDVESAEETPEVEAGDSHEEEEHKPDVAKPAEP